jgi:hypothetical protein
MFQTLVTIFSPIGKIFLRLVPNQRKRHSKTSFQIEKKLFPLRFQIENADKKYFCNEADVFSIRIR